MHTDACLILRDREPLPLLSRCRCADFGGTAMRHPAFVARTGARLPSPAPCPRPRFVLLPAESPAPAFPHSTWPRAGPRESFMACQKTRQAHATGPCRLPLRQQSQSMEEAEAAAVGARARRPLHLVQATQQVREHAPGSWSKAGRERETLRRNEKEEAERSPRQSPGCSPCLLFKPMSGVCQARPQSLLPHAREAGEATNTAPQTQFAGPLKTSCVSTPQHAHRATFP